MTIIAAPPLKKVADFGPPQIYDECPICMERWYDLDDSYDVCHRHLDYLVTICDNCGRKTFSSAAGMCPVCFDLRDEDIQMTMEAA